MEEMSKRTEALVEGRRDKEGSNRAGKGIGKTLDFEDLTEKDIAVLEEIAECFKAVSNMTRLKILIYCLKPRSFSDIVFTFRLNPASFKFHERILEKSGLIEKVEGLENTPYKTTALGKGVLNIAKLLHETVETFGK